MNAGSALSSIGVSQLACAVLLSCAACTDTVSPEDSQASCPVPQGEFGASDCAWLSGRAIDISGKPIVGLGIRVDSVDQQRYVFGSNSTVTGEDGRFEVVVLRYDPAILTTHVDSATVPIKGYLHDSAPGPGEPEDLRAVVTMSMAPMGEPVEITKGDLLFVPLGGGESARPGQVRDH